MGLFCQSDSIQSKNKTTANLYKRKKEKTTMNLCSGCQLPSDPSHHSKKQNQKQQLSRGF